ncbi:MAG: acetylglutamate kinase [Leptospira sp.]|nr:acetylglutamate kinase [Leptospira sp.]
MNSKDILAKVFEITRDPRDGLHFLEEFKSLSPESFALLYADVNTIMESSEALFSDIKLLTRLELFPVLVLEEESVQYLSLFFPPKKSNAGAGVGFPYQIITDLNSIFIQVKESIQHKRIPILIWNKSNFLLDAFILKIIKSLNINKVIQLHHDGPIYNEDTGKVISLIPTGEILESYKSNSSLSESDRDIQFLVLAESLVQKCNDPKFTVVLTSPYTLLRELFTVKGSGTLVKRENKILKCLDFSEVNSTQLFLLIENSFKKKLNEDFKKSKFDVLYLEDSYQGCAWLNKTKYGYLLSKFAVNETARGAGVGRDIWDLILKETLPLFWRAKPNNNINKWYMKVAQGIEKDDTWYYYWLEMPREQIPEVIQFLKNMPEDFF